MENLPLISVIIPVYNGEEYVKSCVKMILSQSYQNIEVIVINDGSKDHSETIAQQFPIKVISFEQNRGLSAARNAGIEASTGDYIHFMDVDDNIDITYYSKLVEAAIHTNADLACGGMISQKDRYETIRYKRMKVFTSTKAKLTATYVGKCGYVWRYLFRKDLLLKHHLRFEEGRYIEDLIFSLSAVYFAEKLVVVPGADYNYRQSENSILTKEDKAHRDQVRRDWQHARNHMFDFARQHNFKIPGVNSGKWAYRLWKIKNWWANH